MPIYEYRCDDCEVSFETFVRAGHDEDAECPTCHGDKLSREMSVFAQARSAGRRAGNQVGTRNKGGKAELQALEQTCRVRAAYSATVERKNEHEGYPAWLASNSAFASLSSS